MTPAEYRRLRELMGLTQPQLGDLLGIDKRTVIRIERGGDAVAARDALAIERLAQLRGVDEGRT